MIDSTKKIAYFKSNPAFKRIFEAMRKQWKAYGRCAGTIKIKNATKAEKDALASFTGTSYDGCDITFKFIAFDHALQTTTFAGMQILDVLEAYFEEAIQTNKEVARIQEEKRTCFFQRIKADLIAKLDHPAQAVSYLVDVQVHRDYVYSLLMREYKKDAKKANAMFVNAWLAIASLNASKPIRLAVLSANVCGSPHYFDRDQAGGKCLLYALCYMMKTPYPKNAEEIASIYYASHILPDDVSNFTTVYGVHLYCGQGIHPAYESFIAQNESYIVSLSNLSRIVRACSTQNKVYIVENQMLFSQLCEEVMGHDVSIICTSGQLKLASLVLVDLLCQDQCPMYYAGDFDPEGILIADRIISRNPDWIHPWFYQVENYEKAMTKEAISEERLAQLKHVENTALQRMADALLHHKRAGYQEALLPDMVKDIVGSNTMKL